MRKNYQKNSDVQNRFTAYLAIAVNHTKIQYCKKKERIRQNELLLVKNQEKGYTDFEQEFGRYMSEQYCCHFRNIDKMQELLWTIEGKRLATSIQKLNDKERKILFNRVFGEQSFHEIGEELGMASKQAEQAYYYVVRKIRKELEEKDNGI